MGTINLASPLPSLTANITIQGPGSSVLTINGTGAGLGSALTINAGVIAEIENLALTLAAITNNGTLMVAGTTVVGQINGTGALVVGSETVPATLQFASGSGASTQTSLTVSPGSTLDINNNRFIIDYGSGTDPIASIAADIISGYHNGRWTGTGITSTAAQSNYGSYGIGYADSADPQ